MLQSLNFKHIFYFWVVAKNSSISKAAAVLNVSQSSISEQIKILESRIGADLFDRSQKKMILTSNGAILFDKLDDFFPNVEELFESLSNHKTTDVKFLRIGLCPTLSQNLRHNLCFSLIEDPHYTVKIIQGENQFLVEAFNRDEIDLFFTTNDNTTINGKYEKFHVAKKRYCLVSNSDVYDKLSKKNKLKSLNQIKFINYTPDSDLHFKSFKFLHKKEIQPIRIAEIDDINLIKNTLLHIDCFSILPINSIKSEIASKTLRQIGPIIKEIEGQITAVYKTKFQSERFLEHLKQISKIVKDQG